MESAALACPACGQSNPSGMRFCGHCAAPLPPTCPSCGQVNPVGMRFCGYCATPLAGGAAPSPSGVASSTREANAAGSSPGTTVAPPTHAPTRHEEERRLVTVLFCDLVGFTPLSERLDPEEVRDIQADYFGAMSSLVERYGGIVEKYAGDAVLALFGVPTAHEDDAERAVVCALAMQSAIEPVAARVRARWSVEPAIRVGVNTGEVVSGTWDASGRQDAAVTGDAVNTAARIQAVAEPGDVLVGAETRLLTRRRIRYGEQRDLVLKGKAGSIVVWPALVVREEAADRWDEQEHVAPLIGRERDLAHLLDAWQRAERGDGGLVTVVGEPGVGKSRLVAEVVNRITSTTTRIVRARALSYGQEISLWLLADLLRSLFGLREMDDPDQIRAALSMAIPLLLPDADAYAEALDVLGEVLGLPAAGSLVSRADPRTRRNALVRSVRLVLSALASRTPLALVLEDLHWIDTASSEVLREVLVDIPSLRALVLATTRPGWSPPWSDWGWPERVSLRPLVEADAARLAGAVLGGTRLAPNVERYIAERAGGNPFFVEELLRALDETGGLIRRDGQMELVSRAAERLPTSLTEIILARLDRLEGRVKQVAQVGSVIGRTFAVRLLAEVMQREQATLEMPLVALQEAEIAFPRRHPHLEYVFKHVTVREVAYNTLIARRRKELHLQTARAIAALYPSDEYAEMIAYHYARTEAPEAVEWLERAGDRALSVYATDAALASYQHAIDRVPGGNVAAVARLQEKLGEALYVAGKQDEAVAALERAVEQYHAVRDLEGAGRATARLGRVHRFRGTPAEGIRAVEVMVEQLKWSGASPALASLHVALSHLYFLVGRYQDMLTAAEGGADLARAVGDDRLLGEAEMRRGTALQMLGRWNEGRQVLKDALPLVEAGGDLITLYMALNNLATAASELGLADEDLQYGEQSLALAERLSSYRMCFALANLGSTLQRLGRWDEARVVLERALAMSRTLSHYPDISNALFYLGRLELYSGNWERASELLREALDISKDTADRQGIDSAHSAMAELAILQGRPEEAVQRLEPMAERGDVHPMWLTPLVRAHLALDGEAHLNRASELAARVVAVLQGRPGRLPPALHARGMVLLQQGRLDDAAAVMRQGIEVARTIQHPHAEGQILFQLGILAERQARVGEARRHFEGALAIFRALGAMKDVERVEQALARG